MADLAAKTGTKRPHSDSMSDGQSQKKRRVQRAIRHTQEKPANTELASQDPVFVQSQLLRSVGAAAAVAGFKTAKPTAMEMFRGLTEEYMLRLLQFARTSMQGARRTQPTPQDFISALSLMPNASTASHLEPHLKLSFPEDVSYPSIPLPDPPSPPAPDFSTLLEQLVPCDKPSYIPDHFPNFPSVHAWQHSPVFPEREKDARKMREKATEEGLLAEQALRKLAAAGNRDRVVQQERKKDGNILKEKGKARRKKGSGRDRIGDDSFEEMFKEVKGSADGESMDLDDVDLLSADDQGLVAVNWDTNVLRRGGKKGKRL